MKRSFVIGGSVGAGILLVLAMLTTVVSAQTVTSTNTSIDSKIVDGKFIKEVLPPPWYLGVLFDLFLSLIIWVFDHWPS